MSLLKLGGKLDGTQKIMLEIGGVILLLLFWWLMAELLSDRKPIYDSPIPEDFSLVGADEAKSRLLDSLTVLDSIARSQATEFEKVYAVLPTPLATLLSFKELYYEDNVIENTQKSIWLNFRGYLLAILISIPIGFIIGLVPLFRGLFARQVDAVRYLPLTALTGLFMAWFGINDTMKITFLAVGIIVYLIPVVVQRIDEVKDVYTKTVFTLGATNWQTIRSVYLPSVLSRVSDDIRVLTAISWTYIIIAELLNQEGGIGSMIYIKGRTGHLDAVFALLLIIIVVGFLQDRIFAYLDRIFFPFKYYKQNSPTIKRGVETARYGIVAIGLGILVAAFVPGTVAQLGLFIALAGVGFCLYGEWMLWKEGRVED